MKRFSKFAITCAFLFMISMAPFSLNAQGPLDEGIPPNPCTDPDDYCPIDGGVVALLVVGVGYGIKKVNDSRKKPIATE